ncbi:uncharacterized protein LOC110887806 [Helianthus annuus]|uniref:uncharacterized protein LOC110887806 n=1 Tax=Helianthus annuus TaxID=4232 RepID=UPI000B8F3B48|nr:uncharacterized protein LOC110887806 [Helianthus annuus]
MGGGGGGESRCCGDDDDEWRWRRPLVVGCGGGGGGGGDPHDRKAMVSYNVNQIRRAYLLRELCQPRGIEFPQSTFQGNELRKFKEGCYDKMQYKGCAFDIPNILKLAEKYPCDFDESEKRRLPIQLGKYIDFVKKDKQFANLDGLSSLARLMVSTNIHLSFTLVYRLLKLFLVLPVATATIERCFSVMNNVKTDMRNRIGDENLSDS